MRDECALTRDVLKKQDRVLRKAADAKLDAAALEVETGVSKHTWASYRRTESREPSVMPLTTFIKLAKALEKNGLAHLACHLIEDSGFALTPTEEKRKDWLALAERTADFASKVIRYQATDNRIDHREDADLMDDARELAAEAQAMVRA